MCSLLVVFLLRFHSSFTLILSTQFKQMTTDKKVEEEIPEKPADEKKNDFLVCFQQVLHDNSVFAAVFTSFPDDCNAIMLSSREKPKC